MYLATTKLAMEHFPSAHWGANENGASKQTLADSNRIDDLILDMESTKQSALDDFKLTDTFMTDDDDDTVQTSLKRSSSESDPRKDTRNVRLKVRSVECPACAVYLLTFLRHSFSGRPAPRSTRSPTTTKSSPKGCERCVASSSESAAPASL